MKEVCGSMTLTHRLVCLSVTKSKFPAKALLMLLLTAVHLGKMSLCGLTSTCTQVMITGQDDDVPHRHLPLSAVLCKQLQVYYTALLPAAMCVACCVRQLMRHKVSLFTQL